MVAATDPRVLAEIAKGKKKGGPTIAGFIKEKGALPGYLEKKRAGTPQVGGPALITKEMLGIDGKPAPAAPAPPPPPAAAAGGIDAIQPQAPALPPTQPGLVSTRGGDEIFGRITEPGEVDEYGIAQYSNAPGGATRAGIDAAGGQSVPSAGAYLATMGGPAAAATGGATRGATGAADSEKVAIMKQWMSIPENERGAPPASVREAFGMGDAPDRAPEGPRTTDQFTRELELRNAQVGIDTAHGPKSPWYNPEANTLAAARVAGLKGGFAREDQLASNFQAGTAGLAQREKESKRAAETEEKGIDAQATLAAQQRSSQEAIAKNKAALDRWGATKLDVYGPEGKEGQRVEFFDRASPTNPGGAAGIDPQQPASMEKLEQIMTRDNIDPNSPTGKEMIKGFKERQAQRGIS